MGWDTYTFLANNVEVIYGSAIIRRKYKTKLPYTVMFVHEGKTFKIYDRGTICNNVLKDLYFKFKRFRQVQFDWRLYYAIYHESINIKYGDTRMSDEEKTVVYYIKYGYWFDMNIPNITVDMVKEYRASYEDISHFSMVESRAHLLTMKNPILFSKWIYAASEYSRIKHIPENEWIDHYTTNDNVDISFDHMLFLSKYPGAISYILQKEYDLSLLTKTKVAEFYIKHIHILDKFKGTLDFDPYGFVKEFLKDNRINKEKKMSVDNAHQYFVKGFVEHKDIREHVKRVYVVKRFAKKRLRDALKQVPFGLLRYIIEFKIYM
tara:strand:- start:3792 stop:4751 length:960 start_codon:yes stop_codon:yes gene_type:complete